MKNVQTVRAMLRSKPYDDYTWWVMSIWADKYLRGRR